MQSVLAPQQPLAFGGRPAGYVIRIRKQQWNHPVRFLANDENGQAVGAGTVPQNRGFESFLVHQDVGFTVVNVGVWPLIVEWV